eukprot:TRINITY_DN1851_c0_g1_i4.p1 TRINITY_DN1851_c0_g1~~TRINITY_DN1851_c0_g1_i4.p1  ORF type:complete len:116 (+),score=19.33 TRINITY_DN1851_c0_g1_i4:85-432(+)
MLLRLQATSILIIGWAALQLVAGENEADSYSKVSKSSKLTSSYSSSSSSSSDSSTDKELEDRLHPAHDDYAACKYTGEWGDCDPFKMIRIEGGAPHIRKCYMHRQEEHHQALLAR